MTIFLERCMKQQPKELADLAHKGVPEPWKSTMEHLIQGPLSKTDIFSCLSFNERPQSWIFFVVGMGASMPPILNLEMYRHVVFVVMLEHWVVVHVDLVTLNAAYMDPKSSDTSTTPNHLKDMLVHWLRANLHDDNMGLKLKLFEKECNQHPDTGILAVSNVFALARGYACAAETDPLRLRSDLIRKMKGLRPSNKPSRRFKQWTSTNGLRTADSLFNLDMPPAKPPKSHAAASNKPSSPLALYATPSATSMSPAAPPNKRKLEGASAITDVPAKRSKVEDAPKEETSSWFFSTWWGKKTDLELAQESMAKLQAELDKAKANVYDIKHEMRELEREKRGLMK